MKTSCFGSRVSCSFRKALRAAATSGRSCSAACTLFFKGQVDVVEEPRNPRLAHLHLFFRQANLKLCKRTIRLFCYKFLNQICMWLKRESLVPVELIWTDTARFALTLDESANSTQSHVVQLSNFLTSMTGFDCRNDTFAQIVGIRLPIHDWPLCPSGDLESDSRRHVNPQSSIQPFRQMLQVDWNSGRHEDPEKTKSM